ncbi:hypothetical protein OOK31_02215 [Streptomyces sp. NBC_00249]|uniref:hypothetical protein n=1 Tax=Streptomyces sp. NBC_00249 TaxID=2975690 RepID=UPI00224DB571|nr:hypothetical protein [Streptomyces sp. NBC_00249]MCX5192715.1 hypothetical protein [Streptomyces sp. NBC_00249]
MSDTRPAPRHNLRFTDLEGEAPPSPAGHARRSHSGATVVTCACGLDTGALPSDDARLVYEQHRHQIRDEADGKR